MYINTSSSNTIGNLKMNEIAVKTKFSREIILLTSIQSYIEDKGSLPSDVQTLEDDDYLNDHFDNTDDYVFSTSDNNTTLIICSNYTIDNDTFKNFYLKHYILKEYGYAPYLDTTTGHDVCHPFPLRQESIDAL
jgi:hypothetical protein